MSDAFVPANVREAQPPNPEDVVEDLSIHGIPLTAPEGDTLEQAEDANGDDDLDEHR